MLLILIIINILLLYLNQLVRISKFKKGKIIVCQNCGGKNRINIQYDPSAFIPVCSKCRYVLESKLSRIFDKIVTIVTWPYITIGNFLYKILFRCEKLIEFIAKYTQFLGLRNFTSKQLDKNIHYLYFYPFFWPLYVIYFFLLFLYGLIVIILKKLFIDSFLSTNRKSGESLYSEKDRQLVLDKDQIKAFLVVLFIIIVFLLLSLGVTILSKENFLHDSKKIYSFGALSYIIVSLPPIFVSIFLLIIYKKIRTNKFRCLLLIASITAIVYSITLSVVVYNVANEYQIELQKKIVENERRRIKEIERKRREEEIRMERIRKFKNRVGKKFKYEYSSKSYYKGYIIGTSDNLYKVKVIKIKCGSKKNIFDYISNSDCSILSASTCSGNEDLEEYYDEGKIIYIPEYCVE